MADTYEITLKWKGLRSEDAEELVRRLAKDVPISESPDYWSKGKENSYCQSPRVFVQKFLWDI